MSDQQVSQGIIDQIEAKGFGGQFKDPDPNDPDVIFDEVNLTRWDKASRKLRELQAKRDALPPDYPPHLVAALDQQITFARDALKRAEGDVSRRQEKIDEWRADAGREEYNASRRKVRDNPNADLSNMTEAVKRQRKQAQINDSKWLARRRDAGIPEAQIQAALVERIRIREAKRLDRTQADAEQAALEALPGYGIV